MSSNQSGDTQRWFIYHYEHLDDLSFVKTPAQVNAFQEMGRAELERLTDNVRKQLLEAGWEGDGDLEVIWLPPFVDTGIEDGWGNYLWHVKQSNNGTSWIASPNPLDFARLKEQNEHFPWETHDRVGIVFGSALSLASKAKSVINDLDRRLKAVGKISDSAAEEIREELLIAAQGELVGLLNEFLDDCYLRILGDVLRDGNRSKLKLKRFKVNLNPVLYTPSYLEESPGADQQEAMNWFTVNGLIRDISATYRFEPFKEKMQTLFSACNYELDQTLQQELNKHVQLRNCVQHHQRQVTPDCLRLTGTAEIVMLGDDKKVERIGELGHIYYSVTELKALAEKLVTLAVTFDQHVAKRVKSVVWIPKKSRSHV